MSKKLCLMLFITLFISQITNSLKIVCRYPQYYASRKLLDNIKLHIKPNGDGKGGTYWGTTGCGKSFTMLFLSRLLMRDKKLASPTIVLITDRHNIIPFLRITQAYYKRLCSFHIFLAEKFSERF